MNASTRSTPLSLSSRIFSRASRAEFRRRASARDALRTPPYDWPETGPEFGAAAAERTPLPTPPDRLPAKSRCDAIRAAESSGPEIAGLPLIDCATRARHVHATRPYSGRC
jgi:hypothetical protein